MHLIPPYENHVVEFKSQWGDNDGQTIKKTLVAFANTYGGDLYIGVNDDGTVCGVQDIHDVEERLCSVAFFYVKKHANLFQSNGLERGQVA